MDSSRVRSSACCRIRPPNPLDAVSLSRRLERVKDSKDRVREINFQLFCMNERGDHDLVLRFLYEAIRLVPKGSRFSAFTLGNIACWAMAGNLPLTTAVAVRISSDPESTISIAKERLKHFGYESKSDALEITAEQLTRVIPLFRDANKSDSLKVANANRSTLETLEMPMPELAVTGRSGLL